MNTYEYLLDRKNNNLPVVPERIVCAANMFEDGAIVLGVRQGCEIMLESAKRMGKPSLLLCEQGQLFRPDGTHNPDVLYSECLY